MTKFDEVDRHPLNPADVTFRDSFVLASCEGVTAKVCHSVVSAAIIRGRIAPDLDGYA